MEGEGCSADERPTTNDQRRSPTGQPTLHEDGEEHSSDRPILCLVLSPCSRWPFVIRRSAVVGRWSLVVGRLQCSHATTTNRLAAADGALHGHGHRRVAGV